MRVATCPDVQVHARLICITSTDASLRACGIGLQWVGCGGCLGSPMYHPFNPFDCRPRTSVPPRENFRISGELGPQIGKVKLLKYWSFYSLADLFPINTFRVNRRRREIYCELASMCLSVHGRMPTLLYRPGCNLGSGRACPLVVHYWADLQFVHGSRCYSNITRTLVTSANAKC